jgi:hypothetical protein
MTTTTASTSKSASQQTSPAPAPIFWPTWLPPALPTAMPVTSPQYDYASVADANGNHLTNGVTITSQWNQLTSPGHLLGSGGNLDVYAGRVVGVGAQAADLSLSNGSTEIDDLAGAFVQMQGPSNVLAATSVTAYALHYGSFHLLGGTATLTINQANKSSPTAPSGAPALVVNAASEKSTAGFDTITINTATIASTSATTPDVFVHLGAEIANVAVTGSGAAVIVGGAGALHLDDTTNSGGTFLTFGTGGTVAWGGSGHNVYAVLAADPITSDAIYDFKGAAGVKTATNDPFAKTGADTLEVSASLQGVTTASPTTGGTTVSFGYSHKLFLAGVIGFKTTDITWLKGV